MRPLTLSGAMALAVSGAMAASSPSVTIGAGTVQGGLCSGNPDAAYFKAIPYAEPPVKELRFAAPNAYTGKFSGGTLDGTKAPASCIQFDQLFAEAGTLSEDCLYVNVWAPANATSSSALPVRVWLYGGGNAAGGISDPLYDGCAVPGTGAVMVSIGYRLGPLGFFATKDSGFSGNQGIQDALLGLQWVQDNIAAFGGDPKKVLLHGESAGAIDSFTIATLEQAPKLFSSAIFQSGGGLEVSLPSAVENISTTFVEKLNCGSTDKACLQQKSVDDITNAFGSLPTYTRTDRALTPAFAPYLDGKVIPVQPTEQGVRVPSIFGTNQMEGTLFEFAQYENAPANATPQVYDMFLQQTYGDQADKIKAQYPLSAFNSTPFPPLYAMSEVMTASGFRCPARRGLNTAAKKGVPVWTYRFAHVPKCSWSPKIPDYSVSLLGPTHSSEIVFVFGETSHLPGPNGTCEMTDDERAISDFMNQAWTSMAAQQKPGNDSAWPAWVSSDKPLGVTIVNSTQAGSVNYTDCQLWDDIDQMQVANETSSSSSSSSSGGSSSTSSGSGPAQTTGGGSSGGSGGGSSAASLHSVNVMTVLVWTVLFMVFAY